MENSAPNSYRNFLPSRNLQVFMLAVVVVGAAIYGIPKLVRYVKESRSHKTETKAPEVSAQAGDPTSRDSDLDGIPDWEEVLVGLDPRNPETTKGVPDQAAYQKIRSEIGIDAFNEAKSQVTETDKLSLAIYDGLSRDATVKGETTNGAVTGITEGEMLNYLNSKKKLLKSYTTKDLTVIGNTPTEVSAFYSAVNKATAGIDDKNMADHISNYISGKEQKSAYFEKKLAQMNEAVRDLLAIPVPGTAAPAYLDSVNALYRMIQIIDQYDPENTSDDLNQFGAIGLIQDNLGEVAAANQRIGIYFSTVLEKNTKK